MGASTLAFAADPDGVAAGVAATETTDAEATLAAVGVVAATGVDATLAEVPAGVADATLAAVPAGVGAGADAGAGAGTLKEARVGAPDFVATEAEPEPLALVPKKSINSLVHVKLDKRDAPTPWNKPGLAVATGEVFP